MLRKFHLSSLQNHEKRLTLDEIDFIQGRVKSKTREAYFMEDPDRLKLKYIAAMDCLQINWYLKDITIKSPEYIKLENESKEKDEKIKNYESLIMD